MTTSIYIKRRCETRLSAGPDWGLEVINARRETPSRITSSLISSRSCIRTRRSLPLMNTFEVQERSFGSTNQREKRGAFIDPLNCWKIKSSLYMSSIAWSKPSKCNVYAAPEKLQVLSSS